MARCKLGRPALGSDSTIWRSGRQGPPLPDTDLAQAAGSNVLPDIVLGTTTKDSIEGWSELQAGPAAVISFMISVVLPKFDRKRK
jgi:hypothetical protein